MTGGMSLLLTGVRRRAATEMIPVRSIASVVTSRNGMLYDKV